MTGYDYASQSKLSGMTADDPGTALTYGLTGGAYNLLSGGDLEYNRQLESMGFQNAFNASEAEKERQFARENRAWQERMSNTAYSRAIADLRSSGVNPYAVINGLGSASTPAVSGGATARSASGVSAVPSGFNSLISSAFSLASAVMGIQAKKEIAGLNALTRRDIAELYANTGYDLETYDGSGSLVGLTRNRKRYGF